MKSKHSRKEGSRRWGERLLGLIAKSRLREGYEDKEFILSYKMNGIPTLSTYICTLEEKKTNAVDIYHLG